MLWMKREAENSHLLRVRFVSQLLHELLSINWTTEPEGGEQNVSSYVKNFFSLL